MAGSIGIIAHDATYGNSAAFAEGLKNLTDVRVWYRFKDKKEMYRQTKTEDRYPVADHYIIFGAFSLRLVREDHLKRATLIITDSTFLNNPDKFNEIIRRYDINIWAMPDLAILAETDNIYYQPFIMPEVDTRKTELICHSPFCNDKARRKGTSLISTICVKNNLPLTIIKDKTWRETIEIKARHLICIDQLFQGLGKSGLEAMLIDCAVLSGVKPEGNHLPPIRWTDKDNLREDLLELIFNKDRMKDLITKQRQWADKNLDPKVTAKKVYDSIYEYQAI